MPSEARGEWWNASSVLDASCALDLSCVLDAGGLVELNMTPPNHKTTPTVCNLERKQEVMRKN